MKNLLVWFVLISTAALGVAVAEPTEILISSLHQGTIYIVC